jgi:hypothetical protein
MPRQPILSNTLSYYCQYLWYCLASSSKQAGLGEILDKKTQGLREKCHQFYKTFNRVTYSQV